MARRSRDMPGRLLPIAIFGDPVLKERSREVQAYDDALKALAADMLVTMYDAPGVGLAAPQIGRAMRLIVWDDGENGPQAMVNPVLSAHDGEQVDDEGCLSVPGLYFPVLRAARVRAEGVDLDGKPVTVEGEGLLARILQHETDHIEGTLILDRLTKESLAALAQSPHRVAVVLTREPKPAGRGSRLTPTPVAEAARAIGLPLVEPPTVKSGPGFEALAAAAPEALVVVAYGEILPTAVLRVPTTAPVNLHFSLLPELRGAAPVQHAILRGLAATGVTTIRMDEGMDTGPVLLRAQEAILPEDDAGSLGARLAALGAALLVETLSRLERGDLDETPQDEAGASVAPKLGAQERVIDWSQPAEAVVRRVRALAPQPGAQTRFGGRILKVFRARIAEGSGRPGTVAVAGKDGLAVAAADGLVALEEVAPEGRGRMSGGEFVRGYRPEPGQALQ
ncbi:MAG: methionyl-tRNA formyltransferase [Actinobacteria bacterium]|nr:methionyl-tRNA formyltransferase [Actinomycetota bacterium]